jgi:methionyl-tRNA formyltransferase
MCLLAADSGRSRAYLDLLGRAGLLPQRAVVVHTPVPTTAPRQPAQTPLFDNVTPLPKALTGAGVPHVEIVAADINTPEVCAAVAAGDESYVIFAGPAGAIVRAPLFATGKHFIHVHPGRVPEFRGSTPMYYSLLAEGRMAASAILLAPRIDDGPILATREFAPPADRTTIDLEFDPWMRAALLVDVCKAYINTNRLAPEPQVDCGQPAFFVIHPVLKHLAILAARERVLVAE